MPVPSTARAYDPETSGARPPASERGEAGEEPFGVAAQRPVQRAGWIARSFEKVALPAGVGVDCIVADTNALPAAGPALRTVVMPDVDKFLGQARMVRTAAADGSRNDALEHILSVAQEVTSAAAG